MLKQFSIRIWIIVFVVIAFFLPNNIVLALSHEQSPSMKTLYNDPYAPSPFFYPQCVYAFIDMDYHICNDNYTALRFDYILFSVFKRTITYELEYDIIFMNETRINGTFCGQEYLYWFDQAQKPWCKPYVVNGHVWAFKDVKEGEMFGRIYIYDDMILERHCSIY